MTAFSPSGQDLDSPPPPQHLQQQHHPTLARPLPNFDPSFPGNPAANSHRIIPRASTDFGAMPGANGNGPLPVPGPQSRMANTNGHGHGHGHGPHMRGAGFDGPRSPPNNKSTSHVPCKFYRQGACQAGKACPFLHSDEPLAERAPCKYFTKGNCKFGHKCALAHILPDGRVVNRQNIGGPGSNLVLGGRVNPPHLPEAPHGSSLLTMQAHMSPLPPHNYPYGGPGQEDFFGAQQPQKSQYDTIPTIDTTFTHHSSMYGSPPNDNGRFPISPSQKGLSVMDAPLPASFDSQGISHMARYGPIAASVPSRFGLATSPPSSFQDKSIADSPALRNLHNSAFGDDSRNNKAIGLASSPPDSIEQPAGRRILHSELRRSRGPLSASLGARAFPPTGDDWEDDNFQFEEDLVPTALHDLLTPQEKMRRFSRDQGDAEGGSLTHRNSISKLGASPTDSNLKFGSPSAATASPSRFSALWGKSRPSGDAGFEPGSAPGASAFGHVGSPLRNSSLHPGASPSMRAGSRTSGDVSPFGVSSPPRQTLGGMGMLSQQLQRTRLSSRASEEGPGLSLGAPMHPGMNRVASGSSVGSSPGSRLAIDRTISSSSFGRDRIEEEQGLFSMEEEEEMDRAKTKDGASSTSSTSNKRYSGLSWTSVGKVSPSLGPIGGQRPGQANP